MEFRFPTALASAYAAPMRRRTKADLQFTVLAFIAIPPTIYQTLRFLFSLVADSC